jgi:hypothetical protein
MSLENSDEVTSKRFYRFRSLSRLLGEEGKREGELATQTIFFPHPEYLNDPMEGYADLFWKGDKILWTNLFRHYLRVFSNCLIYARLTESVQDFEKVKYFIDNFTEHFATKQAKELFEEISELFFSCSGVQELVDALGQRKSSSTEEELYYYLVTVHDLAFHAVTEIFAKRGLIPAVASDFKSVCQRLSAEPHRQNQQIIDSAAEDSRLQIIFEAAKFMGESRSTYIEDFPARVSAPMRLLVREFPHIFLREIRRLIYPEWYAACFMGDYRNASVWGTYGDNYTGVCLIFKAKLVEVDSSIELCRKKAYGARKTPSGEVVERSEYGYCEMGFKKVDYVAKHVQVDFFANLGQLSIPVLNADWYSYKGRFSAIGKVDDSDEFRRRYWDSFQRTVTKKLSDWSHEDEYRLLLYGMALDYSDDQDRALKYKFEDLDGIIFGMRTPPEKKREIVSIIHKKCEAENRSDFNFYQSYYSAKSGKIEMIQVNTFRGQARP